jgi:hypothetical protein
MLLLWLDGLAVAPSGPTVVTKLSALGVGVLLLTVLGTYSSPE